jgi:hypothetical protein
LKFIRARAKRMSEINEDEAVDEDEEDPYDERLGNDKVEGMVISFH